MDRHTIPPLVKKILAGRGFKDESEMRSFLFAGSSSLSDPFMIPAMKTACETVARAIEEKKKIFVYGDGDVDGITGTFLVLSFLKSHGAEASYYLTHRLEENYEIDQGLIEEISREGYSLLIAVDTGISSVEALEKAEKCKMGCIVLDHHISNRPEKLPECHSYVNPFVEKWNESVASLCGAGIAFKFVTGMEHILCGSREKRLSDMYEIPCLAVLADFVPLTGENRIFVKEGLKKLPFTSVEGLRRILEFYSLTPPFSTRDITMKLNPKLNSPGRYGKPEMVLELFFENDENLISQVISGIDAIDRERYRSISKIIEKIESSSDLENGFVFSGENCRGLSGIIASRLSGKYNRPFMVCYEKNNIIRGSIRAPEGYMIHGVRSEMEKYVDEIGGHSHAVGFKCSSTHIDRLRAALDSVESREEETLGYDCELDIEELNPSLIGDIYRFMEPFGKGNPHPVFLCRDVQLKKIRAGSDLQKRCWAKKKNSLFEALLPSRMETCFGSESANILYTPFIRESDGLYRIFLRIAGVADH